MNILQHLSKLIVITCSSLLALLLSSHIVMASDDIVIDLTTDGCNVMAEAEDNRCDAGQCGGDPACVCAEKGQFLIWQIDSGDRFKLLFSGDDPLRNNCGKNYAGSHKCKIKEEVSVGDDYNYIIKLERCDDGSDPRIVIRGR